MANEPIKFTERDTPAARTHKLNQLFRRLMADPTFDKIRVGAEGLWTNDNAITCAGLTMPTGAVADYALVCDGDGAASWGSVTTSPPGSDTQVPFNDAGAWGAEAGLSYDKATNKLTVPTLTVTDELQGSRQRIEAGRGAGPFTADTYLYGATPHSADQGVPMRRAGKIVSMCCRLLINSYTPVPNPAIDFQILEDGSDLLDYTRLTVSGTGWAEFGTTRTRGVAAAFSANCYLTMKLKVTGTVSFSYSLTSTEVQLDT